MTLEQFIQEIADFARTHQALAPLIVGALAFGESLAFISLLLPAWSALLAMGALIGAGAIDFVPIWIAGSIGAALGDWLSYWLGVKFEAPIGHMWPLSRHPTLLPRGHAFIEKYGVYAIFIGRFFGPLRASVPLVAGIFEMNYWHFQAANFSSAFVWTAVLLELGDIVSKLINWSVELFYRLF
jgi:membrane protein DedA with SNARE-associated domain